MDRETLIVGTAYVQGAAAVETFRLWANLVRRLNPGTGVYVIDSASPDLPETCAEIHAMKFPDNIGHLSAGGRDGWGRAFSAGVRMAIQHGYDYLVNLDCDMFFARPVSEVIDRMARHGVKCAAPMAIPYQFTETALSFWSVEYLKDIDLVARYDWEHPVPGFPEQRIDKICENEMFALPLKGLRNDMRMTPEQLKRSFPDGIDWIHHAAPGIIRTFLEMNGFDV